MWGRSSESPWRWRCLPDSGRLRLPSSRQVPLRNRRRRPHKQARPCGRPPLSSRAVLTRWTPTRARTPGRSAEGLPCTGTARPGQRPRAKSPGKHGTILDGVSAVSAAVAWAAGQSCASPTQTTATTCVPYILRWNGKQWTTAATSVPRSNGENMLSGMVGLSAKNAWAVGTRCASACTGASPVDNTLVLYWNGKSWS